MTQNVPTINLEIVIFSREFAGIRWPVYSGAAGMRTEQQLMENVGTADAPGLSEEEYRQLREVLEPNVYEAHR